MTWGKCQECDVRPGQHHVAGCDVEQCPYCGGQLTTCPCEHEPPLDDRMTWTGLPPGAVECKDFGCYAKEVPGRGRVPCRRDEEGAVEDVGRLRWDREHKRFTWPWPWEAVSFEWTPLGDHAFGVEMWVRARGGEVACVKAVERVSLYSPLSSPLGHLEATLERLRRAGWSIPVFQARVAAAVFADDWSVFRRSTGPEADDLDEDEAEFLPPQEKARLLAELKARLADTPPGGVAEAAEIERRLAACWCDLRGDSARMTPLTLRGRMEEVRWSPPLLSFRIERQGPRGSRLETWAVNLDEMTAIRKRSARRRYDDIAPRMGEWRMWALANEIAAIIAGRRRDRRVFYRSDGSARVMFARIFPDAFGRTGLARSRRLARVLTEVLAWRGWEALGFSGDVFRPRRPAESQAAAPPHAGAGLRVFAADEP